jgi:hypothetical protein
MALGGSSKEHCIGPLLHEKEAPAPIDYSERTSQAEEACSGSAWDGQSH